MVLPESLRVAPASLKEELTFTTGCEPASVTATPDGFSMVKLCSVSAAAVLTVRVPAPDPFIVVVLVPVMYEVPASIAKSLPIDRLLLLALRFPEVILRSF